MEINVIYCGDNLEIMREMPDESVDLIYLDPPFFSNRQYEVIWGDDNETRSFDDRWEGGIEHYIGWMQERLVEMHRILAQTGSIYLHCDHHAVHYLKVEMDKIFGINNFRNDIVWQRTDAHNNVKRKYGAIHDNILFYSKSSAYMFDVMADRDELSPSGLKEYSLIQLENGAIVKYRPGMDGRRLKLENATVPGVKGKDGKILRQYTWRGAKPSPRRSWIAEKDVMEEMLADGRLHLRTKSKGAARCKVMYLDERSGIAPQDIWYNVGRMKGGIRYPTEKPERLLYRIISMSSKQGDVVFDPFCGCGTATYVSRGLKRNWIGVDISPIACSVIADRLEVPLWQIKGMPMTTEELAEMEPHEFQQWVCTRMEARNTSPDPEKSSGGDGGIDGVVKSNLLTTGYAGSPIQVKRSKNVGVNVVKALFATMHDKDIKTGFIVALSFGKGAVEKVAKYKNEGSVEIILLNAEDIAEDGYFKY